MTRLLNEPARFAEESAAGFAMAFERWVRPVSGGVVRRGVSASPTVAVVIGGGSGHYPAFSGLVGAGMAHGAAMGNVFASPSAQQIYSVATAANQGNGVLFAYGNYAGDVLNFDQAEARLRAKGIPCESVVVTDDVSSALATERSKRRGIAGGLTVFKVAGAAADAGYALDEVVALARRANDRTRSFGVAFTGCTLPGATEPLFMVPESRMAVGMGIHGESGLDEIAIPSADGLAELMVSRLLAERPEGAASAGCARVVPILNGLGSIKYEELFVVYGRVAALLRDAGLTVVEPEVGELVTSFDMAGISLTLSWLDEELEHLWAAPANTPAFRKGAVSLVETAVITAENFPIEQEIPHASEASRSVARWVVELLAAVVDVIDENVDELGRIDAIAGDGDHGIGMQRGAQAAYRAATRACDRGAGAGTTLAAAADAWADRAGGTSGALWGIALRELATALGDESAPDGATLTYGVTAATAEIVRFGKAEPGDKTMVDVLLPFRDAMCTAVDRGIDVSTAVNAAVSIAENAAKATSDLLPRIGRARPHAEKSLGTPDPGAVSLALVLRAVLERGTKIISNPDRGAWQ